MRTGNDNRRGGCLTALRVTYGSRSYTEGSWRGKAWERLDPLLSAQQDHLVALGVRDLEVDAVDRHAADQQ